MNHNYPFDPQLEIPLGELMDILESNISKKSVHVDRLIMNFPEHASEIKENFKTWQNLEQLEVPAIRPEMDVAFYKMLNAREFNPGSHAEQPAKTRLKWINTRRLAIAATFLIGLFIGQWMDFGTGPVQPSYTGESTNQSSSLAFASLDLAPSPFERIKSINKFKERDIIDLKIIEALNKVILHDPNVNVRLTAIETMSLFSEIPEARKYLIEAIPYQHSSIVQLELADIMIELEEKESAGAWQELLTSDQLETDVRLHLKENLKSIL